ncbi:MAG: HAD family phosphatase [Candidatus Omnitrophica bacterium]|jgi:beta-phosphoglucomutase-like phosphatase (HAD superfamily)|nr:HAD family phosphatase [Candidatus Omnitrophota bacterium]
MSALEETLFSKWEINPAKTIGMIFDVDELLFDNKEEIFLAYQSLLSSRNISLRENENFPGKNLFDILSIMKEQYSISESIELLVQERRNKYIELLNNSQPKVKEGVKEIFCFLEQHRNILDIRTAYTSSSEKIFIDIILKRIFQHCQLNKYIDNADVFFYKNSTNLFASTCWQEGLEKKPSPMLYKETLKKIGLSAKQCIAFEDSRSGIEAALGAGLGVIFVPSSEKEMSIDLDKYFSGSKKICKTKSLLDFLPVLSLLINRIKKGDLWKSKLK